MVRHIVVYFLLIIMATKVNGQNCTVRNLYLTRPDTMVLFKGWPAMLEVSGTGLPSGRLILDIDTVKFSVTRYSGSPNNDTLHFAVWANSYSLPTTIPFTIKDKSTGRQLKKLNFSFIPQQPYPIACIGNTTSGTITKANLLEQTMLWVKYTHPLLNYPFYVHSFVFRAQFSGDSYNVNCTSGDLGQLKEIFKKIPPHTTIFFEHVVCTCPDCTLRVIKDLTLTVL